MSVSQPSYGAFGDSDYRGLFEEHAAVKLLIDPVSGKIVDANKAAAAFYGWSRAQLRNMRIQDINLASSAAIAAEMDRARRHHRTYFDFRHQRADGSVRDVEVYSSGISMGGRELLHSIIIDATERKRAEELLVQRERYLRKILETTTDGFWVLDLHGGIVDVNRAYCAMSGYTREELIGHPASEINTERSDDDIRAHIRAIVEQGSDLFETRHRHKNGQEFDVEVSVSYLDAYGGRLVCFFRDITERKRTEARMKSLLEQQKVVMGEVHHRIKNDMNLVRSLLWLQAEESENPDTRESLSEAGRRVAVVSRVYAQLYQGDDPHSVDLPEFVREIIDSLEASTVPEAVRMQVQVEDVQVSTRESLSIGIIINELVTNAAKYAFADTESGRIDVSVEKRDGGNVRLRVADTGPGFPQGCLDGDDSGYGLTVVETLSSQHGGELTLSNDGGGVAEVWLTLD